MGEQIKIGLHGGGRMVVSREHPSADWVFDVSEVTPQVLAFGLSYVTRFGGQYGAYSVGEHTVRGMRWMQHDKQDKALIRGFAIHDAGECLGEGDVQRFVKRHFPSDGLHTYSRLLTLALWGKFCPADRPIVEWYWDRIKGTVKEYDVNIGILEASTFKAPVVEKLPEWVTVPFGVEPSAVFNHMSPRDVYDDYLRFWDATK